MSKNNPAEFPELPSPLPQVGAILHLDTRLPQRDVLRGNQHWTLSGSCVLVGSDRVLTLSHVLDLSGDAAVFLPYRGIHRLQADRAKHEADETRGDNLLLVDLESPTDCVPLRHYKISSHYKYEGRATACGYGLWHGTPWEKLDGLQQRHPVELGLDCRSAGRPTHYDNLDLIWTSSKNGGLAAGRANSGGPLLWSAGRRVHPEATEPPDDWGDDAYRFVSLSRERKRDPEGECDLQISSWIGWCRKRWLDSIANGNGRPGAKEKLAHQVVAVAGDREAPPVVAKFPVPKGSRRVRCTLNASDGLRLQMKLASDAGGDWLAGIRRDNHATGRFLARDLELPEDAETVSVGVAPYERGPVTADQVVAQICCRFV